MPNNITFTMKRIIHNPIAYRTVAREELALPFTKLLLDMSIIRKVWLLEKSYK